MQTWWLSNGDKQVTSKILSLFCVFAENTYLIQTFDNNHFQTFDTATPHAEWKYVFPKTKPNDDEKKYKLHVTVSKNYLFVDLQVAEKTLDVEITSE